MGTIMMNGQLIREEEAVVSVFDHGLLYGVGAFETLRLYDGHPFLFEDHIDRLTAGCGESLRRPTCNETSPNVIQIETNGLSLRKVEGENG